MGWSTCTFLPSNALDNLLKSHQYVARIILQFRLPDCCLTAEQNSGQYTGATPAAVIQLSLLYGIIAEVHRAGVRDDNWRQNKTRIFTKK